ncbi:MAG: hypothetical protein JO086_08275 [Acidimicrobiia bacterium]|nr:hypothetical protein [Acidimicrobiia bacterium]
MLVAWLALVLGVVNSALLIYQWRQSGPVVAVRTAFAFPVYGPNLGEQHVSVEAFNKGRSPTTVEGWGIALEPGHGDLFVQHPEPWQPSLPHRLEPGASATWYMRLSELEAELAKRPGARPVAFVRLAGGARCTAPVHLSSH